ncbi:helix-turn-helix domain-containing protein [Arundinibacter roseus]|uniref:XRE family transcriptional regulator n=1 Tax=Arundinibacter roseus TaxID=2070510 RepID=A0A4R4KQ56_9BACT|nr:helix-turn-helix transcriptional regulator [Arundinibacter roseus]TDB69076.1 XRE family transcriptional regulator [Arundinibacter roseus]
MTTGERFKIMLESMSLSKYAFANKIGVSSTVINGIVNNQNNPGHKVLTGIQKNFPEINTGWLLTGEGDMKAAPEKITERDYLLEHLIKLEDQFNRLLNQLDTKDRQIEKLMDLLGKLEGANVDQLYPTKVIQLYPVAQQQHG